jgi:hypothetical protein
MEETQAALVPEAVLPPVINDELRMRGAPCKIRVGLVKLAPPQANGDGEERHVQCQTENPASMHQGCTSQPALDIAL